MIIALALVAAAHVHGDAALATEAPTEYDALPAAAGSPSPGVFPDAVRSSAGEVYVVTRDGLARVGSPQLLSALGVPRASVRLVDDTWLGAQPRAPQPAAVAPGGSVSSSTLVAAGGLAFDGLEAAAVPLQHALAPGMRGGVSLWLWLWRGSGATQGAARA